MKLRHAVPTLVMIAAFAAPARAHVCNVELANVTTTCGEPPEEVVSFTPELLPDGTISFTDAGFKRFGWIAGTNPGLGDSHELDGGNFFVFHLDQPSAVTITFSPAADDPNPLDTAFTLYRGTLPDDAHDDAAYDPLNPVDDMSFLPVASSTDTAPKPRHHYRAHDGYRDTLNYVTTGGLDGDGAPVHPFVGQFDALGSWSMANEDAIPGDPMSADGNWATIKHIIHRNFRHAGGVERIRNRRLPAGDYTIAAGGANCNDSSIACTAPLQSGTLTLKIEPR